MNFNAPLSMPEGSVRALLTILTVVAAVVLHVIKQPSAEMDGFAALALGSYFGYRTAMSNPATPPAAPLPPREPDVTLIQPEVDPAPSETTGFVPGE